MELRHLRYFVAVGETLHFGRAAARLGIAQPSLSQQLQQLEAQLQTMLLRRTKRQVELTEAGRLFLDEARDIPSRADRAAVVARRASMRESDRVRIGFPYWVDVTPILATVRRLADRPEGFRFDIRTMAVPHLVAALKDGTVDIALVRPPLDEPTLTLEELSAEPFVVALPAGHRLAARRRIPLAALSNERFVLFPRQVVPRFHDLAVGCRQAGFVPNVQDEVDSAYLI